MLTGALAAHSGQRMPTGVCVMQSGQIGRPQFEQLHARLAVGVAVAVSIPNELGVADCYQIPRSNPPSTGSTQPET